ncbi:hypothetical protein BJ508DRAFT_332716 [Ascobolus immersus RN42]|uniref:Uncharacterized protein n=1 Tax=Ascobolus immersus RN42 TaxID=1160509 RepID=A0A3N4HRV5_ASCIM|nr:hypothetical protein BJ508DRAFT_332716 [Ascobolus immersus RN42]
MDRAVVEEEDEDEDIGDGLGIQDDLTIPLEVIETAVNLPRIPPPDNTSALLLNTSSSRTRCPVVAYIDSLRIKRQNQLENEIQKLPKGYHYSLRNRETMGINYNEDTETEAVDSEFESASDDDELLSVSESEGESDIDLAASDGEITSQDETAMLSRQLGGIRVSNAPYIRQRGRVLLRKAGRTGGMRGKLISDQFETLRRGIVKHFIWKKI